MLPLVLALLVFTGCDSDGLDANGDARVTIEGEVTDDSGFGKTAAAIEGAVVTAATVQSDGSLQSLSGEATTNAEGRFALDIEAPSDLTVVIAEKGSFTSKVLVATESR
ncbi:MAG TPA: carboxypeptidase-like regulatory domain-containing protein, partial [Rhodothermales bacterium]|nr:carboxypeptidase-like regulatory domain-containing protein [Rhodothermales bacterium]